MAGGGSTPASSERGALQLVPDTEPGMPRREIASRGTRERLGDGGGTSVR
jgi:hypothetical protein